MRYVIPADLDGERADKVLSVLAELSRSVARELVESGGATFGGEVLSAASKAAAGLVVEVELPEPEPPLSADPDVEFEVVFEDEHLAVIDKPAGLVVHPGAGTSGGTLAAGAMARWPHIRGVGDEGRWGLVHRLDRDTSGAMVIALSHDAFSGLRSAMAAREIERRYLALVLGTPAAATGTIEAPLVRDPRNRSRFTVRSDGRPARTHYGVVASWSDKTLLAVTLDTGRTHQIRVHLQAIDLPVIGDRTYGRPESGSRMFLHAAHLEFDHPILGDRVSVDVPLPPALLSMLDALGEPESGSIG
ncbi:RluA family pseudouridine synthase [bacterium]|nr:RluA family pseudouridine synthase [bacterium]